MTAAVASLRSSYVPRKEKGMHPVNSSAKLLFFSELPNSEMSPSGLTPERDVFSYRDKNAKY